MRIKFNVVAILSLLLITGNSHAAVVAVPSEFIATPVTSTQVNLSWKDIGGGASYIVERSTTNAKTGFTQIDSVNAGVRMYSDMTATGNKIYWYRIKASTVAGDSAYSKVDRAQTPANTGNVFYILPSGNDSSNCSNSTPCKTFSKAYSLMQKGDTLVVKDGTYVQQPVMMRLNNGTEVLPPSGSDDTHYTRVVAEHDGAAVIDAQGQMGPFNMESWPVVHRQFIEFRGMVSRHQGAGAMVYGMDHIKFMRMGFEDGPGDNAMTFTINGRNTNAANPHYSPRLTSYILVEESFAWGSGRYKFHSYESTNVVFRRTVARHDGYTGGEPVAVYQMYASDNAQCQNCISVDGDRPYSASEYGGSFSIACTDAPASNIEFTGSIALNVDLPFLATCNANDLPNAKYTNSVGWHLIEGGLMRNSANLTNITLGDIYGPRREKVYYVNNVGVFYVAGTDTNPNPTMTNSLLSKIKGIAVDGFSSVTNTFSFNPSPGSHGQATGSGNFPSTIDPGLKYITRTTDASVASAQGKGANITKKYGWPGTLWGETVKDQQGNVIGAWNTETDEALWPFPYEEIMAKYMQSNSGGNRGFAALYPTSASPLTDYIWKYLGNAVPEEFTAPNGGGTIPPPTPPSITTQPKSQSVNSGDAVSFDVVASGSSLSYQWKRNGTDIANATSSTYTIAKTSMTDDGTKYTVVVSNTAGVVTSSEAMLTVKLTLSITTHPQDKTVTAGQTATFSVVAAGTSPLTYQWQKDSADINGATSASYTTPSTTVDDHGTTYRVKVSNPAGTIISESAVLFVNAPVNQPPVLAAIGNKTVTMNSNLTFVISATDSNNDTLVYSATGLPAGATFNASTRTFNWTPTVVGTFNNIVFTVSDGKGGNDSKTMTVTVTPAQTGYTLTTVINGSGSVKRSPDQATYQGQVVTLTATPGDGWQFTGWMKENETWSDNPTTITMDRNKTITANFKTVTPVNKPPVVNAGPDQTIAFLTSATLSETATDDGLPELAVRTQQWTQVSGPGTAIFNYTVHPTTVSFSALGTYVLRFTFNDSQLSASDDVTITVNSPIIAPSITTQPQDQKVDTGKSATFAVVADGSKLVYQWKKNDVDIAGATSNSYTTPTTTSTDNNTTFSVVVSNSTGSAISRNAILTVVVSAPAKPVSIWSDSVAPKVKADPETNAVEVGLKFKSDVSGNVTGVRFYKGSNNSGTHTGRLWSKDGKLLGSVTFTNETKSGWQQATFAAPIAIAANTTYVISYSAPKGRYADDVNYFATKGVDSGPLHALRNGVDGPNGVYAYGVGTFPKSEYKSSNYWVDVIFTPNK